MSTSLLSLPTELILEILNHLMPAPDPYLDDMDALEAGSGGEDDQDIKMDLSASTLAAYGPNGLQMALRFDVETVTLPKKAMDVLDLTKA
ncbi:hypothetical protein N0V86_003386 [Didymella sp. IMI 355093]|nr:hypothetical protein N0V86_003386 [Didymella sp. IMI 355093]